MLRGIVARIGARKSASYSALALRALLSPQFKAEWPLARSFLREQFLALA